MKTMLTYLIFLLCVINYNQASAQLNESDSFINLSIGLGTYYGSGLKTTLPALEGSYEYMVSEVISVGGFLGAYGAKYEYSNNAEIKYNYLHFGGLANYHFVNDETFNVYAGLRLGYVNSNTKSEFDFGNGSSISDFRSSGFLFAAQIGGRYYLSENLALNAELGYGISVFKVGVTFIL